MSSLASCVRDAPDQAWPGSPALRRSVLRLTLQAGVCLVSIQVACRHPRFALESAVAATGCLAVIDHARLTRRRDWGWDGRGQPPWEMQAPIAMLLGMRIGRLWAWWWTGLSWAAARIRQRASSRLRGPRRRKTQAVTPAAPYEPVGWAALADLFAQCMTASGGYRIAPVPVNPTPPELQLSVKLPAPIADSVLIQLPRGQHLPLLPPRRVITPAYRFRRFAEIAAKEAIDRAGAAALLVLATPLMAAIALTIKMDSPGPVLFAQTRTGRWQTPFTILKFRTMRQAPDGAEARQTERNDPRCTRVGRFLRRSSLDELPQLWNVLRGEMSLVGPRPHADALHGRERRHRSIAAMYRMRYDMKPGLTGWAQIHGFRGAVHTPQQMRHRVEHDVFYVQNWTLWLDIRILARTPWAILSAENAF